MASPNDDSSEQPLLDALRDEAQRLGFSALGVTDTDPGEHSRHLRRWLELGYAGEMDWMAAHGDMRHRPAALMPGTLSVISVRMDYLPSGARDADEVLADPGLGYVSRYALGRDYHKVLRSRLKKLGDWLNDRIGPLGSRACVDSAPVLEKAFAEKSGLGWIGKHTLLLHRDAGSWFFLGELLTDLPPDALSAEPLEQPVTTHCGSCTACIDVCPTRAIVAPRELDARRCISYLTIEHRGSIDAELRPLMGNRIFGCDDCQLVCPWNRYASLTSLPDFAPRNGLDGSTLVELFAWTRDEFDTRTLGSAIRRIGYEMWLRNIAIALGNAPTSKAIVAALGSRAGHDSELVREHVAWALERHQTGV